MPITEKWFSVTSARIEAINQRQSSSFYRKPKLLFQAGALVLPNDVDLLNPPAELEKKKHKLKRLVQSPNSFFMDVKCQGCFNITTVFSHSQTVVVCGNCQTVLCQPTGGRARLTEGCSFRRKGD
nr:40S ribosomal protein S27-2 [Ipomoea batatas]GME17417.1 40S ribosomal protein S27-2 [Ipomoea batatas]